MQRQRIQRLLGIAREIVVTPTQKPSRIYRKFSMSKSQFYRDLETLAEWGFPVEYQRPPGAFRVGQEKPLEGGLPLKTMVSLTRGLCRVPSQDLFFFIWEVILWLREKSDDTGDSIPFRIKESLLEEWFSREGWSEKVLDLLMEAIREKKRVAIQYQQDGREHRVVDPEKIVWKDNGWVLSAYLVGEGRKDFFNLSSILEVKDTPFKAP
jgi:predicted DNA-binding transcriptional regulator YafY